MYTTINKNITTTMNTTTMNTTTMNTTTMNTMIEKLSQMQALKIDGRFLSFVLNNHEIFDTLTNIDEELVQAREDFDNEESMSWFQSEMREIEIIEKMKKKEAIKEAKKKLEEAKAELGDLSDSD
jgi:hypothetical protein